MVKKRILAGICAAFMAVTANVVPIVASAEDGDTDVTYTYETIKEYDFTNLSSYAGWIDKWGMCAFSEDNLPTGLYKTSNGTLGMVAYDADGNKIANTNATADEIDHTLLYANGGTWAGVILDAGQTLTAGDTYKVTIYGSYDKTSRIMFTADARDGGDNNNQVAQTAINDPVDTTYKDYVFEATLESDAHYVVTSSSNQSGPNIFIQSVKIEKRVAAETVDPVTTHDSDYFSFTATADEMNEFNTIAIKLRDTTTDEVTAKAAVFSFDTVFSGEGQVEARYAVKITDVPENLKVEAVKLYVE